MRLGNNVQKLLFIIGTIGVIGVILFVLSKPDSMKKDALTESNIPQASINPSIPIASPSPKPTGIDNKSQLIDPELRYQNIVSLMSQSVSEMTEAEKKLTIEQILSELPFVVRDGKMHPDDAVFAHTQLLERQNINIDAAMIKEIELKYASVYPSGIKDPRTEHDLD